MDAFDLHGTVAVVTGGNRGIGLGMATGLARAGAAVAVWARNEDKTAAAVERLESLGAAAAGMVCDVQSESDVQAAMAATVERFGHVDAGFVNAGVSGLAQLPDVPVDEWNRILDVNVVGASLTAHALCAHMVERGSGGSLVFTTSIGAHLGMATAPHYAASKGALLQLSRSMAVGLARYGIRVNAISPGFIETEMTQGLTDSERMSAALLRRTPMRRWGTPDDFEGAAVFLASPASAFMTGAELVIDGGFTAF